MTTVLEDVETLNGELCEFDSEEEATAYDRWFRDKVERSLRRAEEPNAKWFTSDQVLQRTERVIQRVVNRNAALVA